jgi:hypothetical protein
MIRAGSHESGLLIRMKQSDRKTYQVYCSMTGQGETFETAEGAAAAFHAAEAKDRPCVIYGNAHSAQILVRTLRIGDQIVKARPGDTEPRFHAAYMALIPKYPTSRALQHVGIMSRKSCQKRPNML